MTIHTSPLSARVRVTITELIFAINAVLPHASTAKNLPHLSAVWFETVDGQLYVVATDRYTLGAYSLGPISIDNIDHESAAAFTAHLELPDVRRLLIWLKHIPSHGADAGLITLCSDHILHELQVFTCDRDSFLGLPLHEGGGFVDWKAEVRGAVSAPCDWEQLYAPTAFNPAYLARFGKAAEDKRTPVVIYNDEEKHARLVTVGERFIGVIQPDERDPLFVQELPAWTEPDWEPGQEAPKPGLSVVGDAS